jgi:hypothetical protein
MVSWILVSVLGRLAANHVVDYGDEGVKRRAHIVHSLFEAVHALVGQFHSFQLRIDRFLENDLRSQELFVFIFVSIHEPEVGLSQSSEVTRYCAVTSSKGLDITSQDMNVLRERFYGAFDSIDAGFAVLSVWVGHSTRCTR